MFVDLEPSLNLYLASPSVIIAHAAICTSNRVISGTETLIRKAAGVRRSQHVGGEGSKGRTEPIVIFQKSCLAIKRSAPRSPFTVYYPAQEFMMNVADITCLYFSPQCSTYSRVLPNKSLLWR